MMGRAGMSGCPYNGANIQVKASTPNTIQYLPVRPQVSNTNPRVPPSLEFLQRFANPQMSPMDVSGGGPNGPGPDANKMQQPGGPGQGMNFYQNCNQMSGAGPGGGPGPGPGGGMNSHMDTSGPDGMMGLGGPPVGMVGGPNGPMGGGMNSQMMRGMRPMRQPGGGNGMLRMQGPNPHMIGGGGVHPFGNGPPNLDGPNDPSNIFQNNQLFGGPPGPKGSPMGHGNGPNGAPNGPGLGGNSSPMGGGPPGDPSQSMQPGPLNGPGGPGSNPGGPNGPGGGPGGPGPNYKSSPFLGPSTNDLKYAQQYHNFQQQLYATSTRSQMNSQLGGHNGPPGGQNLPGILMESNLLGIKMFAILF
ncbi:collagen alpha-1(X) chain-like [Episyrphus balteatus]|uniref:collagen alpha-1(X) chain-like n=1 Tax=Episyrphus balteatus TaxID=286459 RepID=UPI00248543DF|nr:collagen alpha-1(X) chain-like [Episyrphus balteatus]